MKYKLHVMQNCVEKVWIYDNITNEIFDENGKQLLTEYPAQYYPVLKPFTREHNDCKKTKNLEMLEILLGLRCNFDCVYCSQRLVRNKAADATPALVPQFLEKLDKSGIKTNEIQFWGGEPLVYWKTLVVLIPELRKRFPDAFMYFPTNGSLLDREKVDFCKKYNVRFSISHDGCHDEGRDYDVLEDPVVLDAVKYAYETYRDGISFGATLQPDDLDPKNVEQYFENIVGKDVHVGTHNVVRCTDHHNQFEVDCATIDKDKLDQFSENIFKMLNTIPQEKRNSYTNLRDRYIHALIKKVPIWAVGTECSHPYAQTLCCDINGRVVRCHTHFDGKTYLGSIGDFDDINILGFDHFSNHEKCRNCLVVRGCKGGCPATTDEGRDISCPTMYAQHYGVFKAAIASLLGVYLKSVEPIPGTETTLDWWNQDYVNQHYDVKEPTE